jgi:hypothetical protein
MKIITVAILAGVSALTFLVGPESASAAGRAGRAAVVVYGGRA